MTRALHPRRFPLLSGLLLVSLLPVCASAAGVQLADGWKNYGGAYAGVSALRQEAMCVVSGLVRSANRRRPSRAIRIARLSDTDCRPAARLIFNVKNHDRTARVDVYPNGSVIWRSGFRRNWVSLAGISFAVGKRPKPLELTRGWRNYGGDWQRAAIARVGDRCLVSGRVKAERRVSLPSTVAVLPPSCRPRKRLVYDLHANSHKAATRVDVLRNGRIIVVRGAFDRWLSLSGISFRAGAAARKVGRRGGGNALRLANGWRNYGHDYQEATYWIDGSLCTLSGLIRGKRRGYIATVPTPCRPARRLIFNVRAKKASIRVDVHANGRVEWVNGGQGGWISLAGIDIPTVAGAKPRAATVAKRATATTAEKRPPARISASKRRTQPEKARIGVIAPSAPPPPRAEPKARAYTKRPTVAAADEQQAPRIPASKQQATEKAQIGHIEIEASAQAAAAGKPRVAQVAPSVAAALGAGPVLVVHEEGGNVLLRSIAASAPAGGESLPGNLSRQERARIEHELTIRLEPAWVYALTSPDELRGVTVSGEGVATELVDPSCVTQQDEGVFTPTTLCDPPTGGHTLHVRFSVEPGTTPGNRDIFLELASGATRRHGTLKIARAGTATLVEAAYFRPDPRRLLSTPSTPSTSVHSTFPRGPDFDVLPDLYASAERIVPIPLPRLPRQRKLPTTEHRGPDSNNPFDPGRSVVPKSPNDRPTIIGELPAGVLEAPFVRLTFEGNGVDGLKFAAPECLISAQHDAIDSDTLQVTATFHVPAAIDPGSHGLRSTVAGLPSAPCTWLLYDPALDPVLHAQPRHKGNAAHHFTYLPLEDAVFRIAPRFLAIAAIGDSYGSGEGAPDLTLTENEDAVWLSERCHRSHYSRLTQGALKIAEIPGVWVVFGNFACSGATINVGAIGPYNGFVPPGPNAAPIAPQVDQVAAWLQRQRLPDLDGLLISFGGNEVGFGFAIQKCVTPPPFGPPQCHLPLPEVVTETAADVTERMEGVAEVIANGWPSNQIDDCDNGNSLVGFDCLQEAFDHLAQELSGRIEARAVFVMEYPDPVSYSSMDRCGSPLYDDHFVIAPEHVLESLVNGTDLGEPVPASPRAHPWLFGLFGVAEAGGGELANVSHAETTWLHEHFLERLNQEVKSAASPQWRFVSGHVEYSQDYGYCTRPSLVHTFKSSFNTQGDVFGAFHPTRAAYDLYGEIIANDMIRAFGLPPRPNIVVLQDSHSQGIRRYVLGDSQIFHTSKTERGRGASRWAATSRYPTEDEIDIYPIPTQFRIQLAPTARSLDVQFQFRRKNRFTGEYRGGVQTVTASRDNRYSVRTEYVAEHDLEVCESLEYWWQIVHSGANGTRTTQTEVRSLTPIIPSPGAADHCPGHE